jgi:hypothetical protein
VYFREYHENKQGISWILVSKAIRKELMDGRHWILAIKDGIRTSITSEKEERYKILLRTILKQHQGNLDHGQRLHKQIRQTRRRKFCIANGELPEQVGFRSGISATDYSHAVNEVMGKTEEFYLKIYINFKDYKRAFDLVEQKFVPHSPKNQGAYDKYIRKIKDIYIHICAKIKIES